MTEFTRKVLTVIKSIPHGRVMSYGQIAAECGNIRAARQVARILHSMSKKYNLPWHRVINSKGKISLKSIEHNETQRIMLENEGIVFNVNDEIDFKIYGYDSNIK